MLLTVTTTHRPATDLGYLLYKHPDRAQRFELSTGVAHVVYPESGEQRCTMALLLEVDPIGLVRGAKGAGAWSLGHYVNDRPYAASSLLAVALGKVFGSAIKGRCDTRPELAQTAIPLEIHIPALPCRGGAQLAERLFAPLGWSVAARPVPLDPHFPEWGESPYVDLHLAGTVRLADALTHLYVLLPVLDDSKHYRITDDEVEKLLRAGGAWLATHPDRELITTRYLMHRRKLTEDALHRLVELDDRPADDPDPDEAADTEHDTADERVPSLAEQRREAILAALRDAGARRVADVGCGEGRLLRELLADPAFTQITGVDVAVRSLRFAAQRLRLEQMSERERARITLLQGSVTYADARLAGLDAIVLSEVIEHVDPPRLSALQDAVFGAARPETVIVTTPNAEFNTRWETLPAGHFRHSDHRFEWSRAQFAAWADAVCASHGYSVRIQPVGLDDPKVGPATQLALFTKTNTEGSTTR